MKATPCRMFIQPLAIFESNVSKSPVAIPDIEFDVAESIISSARAISFTQSIAEVSLFDPLATPLRDCIFHIGKCRGQVPTSTFIGFLLKWDALLVGGVPPTWRPNVLPRVRWRLVHVQAREVRIVWPKTSHGLPIFRRFPPTARPRRRRGQGSVQFEGGRRDWVSWSLVLEGE